MCVPPTPQALTREDDFTLRSAPTMNRFSALPPHLRHLVYEIVTRLGAETGVTIEKTQVGDRAHRNSQGDRECSA